MGRTTRRLGLGVTYAGPARAARQFYGFATPSALLAAAAQAAPPPVVLRFLARPHGLEETTRIVEYDSDVRPLRRHWKGAVWLGQQALGLRLTDASMVQNDEAGAPSAGLPPTHGSWTAHVDYRGPGGGFIGIDAVHRGTPEGSTDAAVLKRGQPLRVGTLHAAVVNARQAVVAYRSILVGISVDGWTPTRAQWRLIVAQLRGI